MAKSSPAFKAQGMQAVDQGSRKLPNWINPANKPAKSAKMVPMKTKKKMSKALSRNYS